MITEKKFNHNKLENKVEELSPKAEQTPPNYVKAKINK